MVGFLICSHYKKVTDRKIYKRDFYCFGMEKVIIIGRLGKDSKEISELLERIGDVGCVGKKFFPIAETPKKNIHEIFLPLEAYMMWAQYIENEISSAGYSKLGSRIIDPKHNF